MILLMTKDRRRIMEKKKFFRKPVNLKFKFAFTIIYLLVVMMASVLKLPCIFVGTIGIPCPGCGMTRALKAAITFDFVKAFSYHWMFWALPIMYIYFLWEGRLFENKKIDKVIWYVIGGGFLANWVYRLIILV